MDAPFVINASPPQGGRFAPSGHLPGRLIANLFALVTARLQLAQIEVEEAAHLALRRLVWLLAAGACGFMALQFAMLFLLLRYDGDARLAMVAGIASTFLVMTIIAVVAIVRIARNRPPLWTLTRSVITDDLDALWRQHDSR